MYKVKFTNNGDRIVETEEGGTVCIVSAVCEDRFKEFIDAANKINVEKSIADQINDIKIGRYTHER